MTVLIYFITLILGIIISLLQIFPGPHGVITLSDLMNVLYLNFESFPLYGIDQASIQNVIVFTLITITLMNTVLREFKDLQSFYGLLLYRKNIITSYTVLAKYHVLNAIKMMVMTFIFFVFMTLVYKSTLTTMFVIILYLTRLTSLMLAIGLLFEAISIRFSENLVTSIFPYFMIMIMISMDYYSSISIVSFVGVLELELMRMILAFVFVLIAFVGSILILKRSIYYDSI
ncbi:hypothetical protein PT040_06270 [Erysipelothrix rhusiopathiae]|nr:hypothetical protein [Erysipelothrix rhusiopathiae]MDE8293067.1 hypothetical protein [Erysipelothrix rhusiopathiae]